VKSKKEKEDKAKPADDEDYIPGYPSPTLRNYLKKGQVDEGDQEFCRQELVIVLHLILKFAIYEHC